MKTKLLLIILSLFTLTAVTAQTPSPTPKATPPLYSAETLKNAKAIQQISLSSGYALKQTAYLSNNIGPRLTGSAQAQRAVEWVAEEMRKLGLEVRLEKLSVPHWVRGEEKGELTVFPGMAPGTTQKIVLTALGGSVATPAAGLSADIVVVKTFAELEALGRAKVEGKIVLFNNRFDREAAEQGGWGAAYGQAAAFRGGGANAASRLGAVAVLVRSAGGSQNRLAHTGAMNYADGVKKIPAAAVSNEDAEMIAALAEQNQVTIKLLLTPQTLPDTVGYNVIADLKGSEKPDEVVIVSGHLDSWDLGTGALDDAVGVAVSMHVPYILKQLRIKPKRTIRFIAWMNEENGLVGGRTYAENEKANIAKHFAAIEADFGAGHPTGIQYTAGSDSLRPFLAPVSEVLRSQGAWQVGYSAGGVGADIGPITRAGVPAFAPQQDGRTYFNYHHTEADTFDKVVPKDLAENASLMAVLAYMLANLEQPLRQ